MPLLQAHQWVADNDGHPAQAGNAQIEAFSEIAALEIGGEDIIRPRAVSEIGFVDLSGGPGGSFAEVIGGHCLGSAGEPGGLRVSP